MYTATVTINHHEGGPNCAANNISLLIFQHVTSVLMPQWQRSWEKTEATQQNLNIQSALHGQLFEKNVVYEELSTKTESNQTLKVMLLNKSDNLLHFGSMLASSVRSSV